MTIYLPDNISGFRQAFNETCDRILRSVHNETFFKLMIDLIAILKEHSLTKDYFSSFEHEYSKWRQKYITMASKILEYNWRKLWQYHRHRFDQCKQLLRIRRIVTAPNAMEFSPLYPRALSKMCQFRYSSPFFRCIVEAPFLFRAVQSQINSCPFLGKHFCSTKDQAIKVVKLKKNDRKKDKVYVISAGIKQQNLNDIQKPFKTPVEPILSLFSPHAEILERKFGIPGCNNDKKRRNMLIRAETDPFFCLERFRFFEQCLNAPNCLPPLQCPAKRKRKIDQKIWESAFERCEREALWYAKAAFLQQNTSNHHMDAFVSCEYEIRRRDFEQYLSALKNHIHAHLYKIGNLERKTDPPPGCAPPGTLKGNFVIDLAIKCWKDCPLAKHDEVFEHYICHCPPQLQLKRDRWDQIIREKKLDPRLKKEKKRGSGKKTCKN